MASPQPLRAASIELDAQPTHSSRSFKEGYRGVRLRNGAKMTNRSESGSSQAAESADEEQSNDDDEADSSNEEVADEEDPEVKAPPREVGITVVADLEGQGHGEVHAQDQPDSQHGAGLQINQTVNNSANLLAVNGNSKKRRWSDVSNSSVLYGGDDDINESSSNYPRKRKIGPLSNDKTGLLSYTTVPENAESLEDAMESSDDEVYKQVDLISDDEEDIEKAEEDGIFSSALSGDFMGMGDVSSHPLFSRMDTTEAMDEIMRQNPFEPTNRDYDDFMGLPRQPEPRKSSETRKYSDGSAKKVRFNIDDDSSDSSSSTEMNDWFPDIFAEPENLPGAVRREWENDTDIDNVNNSSSDGEGSYWDFSGYEHERSMRGNVEILSDGASSDSDFSDYDGDTTDEECSLPSIIHQPKSVLHRPSSSPSDGTVSPKPTFRRNSVKSTKRCGPQMGTFTTDPKKATAYVDHSGKRMIMHPAKTPNSNRRLFPPSSRSSTVQNSPVESPSDIGELTPQTVSDPRDIMFGGLFGIAQDTNNILRGQVVGPPEAFYPFVSIRADGASDDGSSEYEDDDTIDGDNIMIEEFVSISEDEEELFPSEFGNGESDATVQPSDAIESTPIQRGRSMTESESMLERFDRVPSLVTSFRSHQDNYRDVAGRHADPQVRAHASQPVRYGKSAETPITPVRKQRGSISRRRPSLMESSPFPAQSSPPAMVGATPSRRGPKVGRFA